MPRGGGAAGQYPLPPPSTSASFASLCLSPDLWSNHSPPALHVSVSAELSPSSPLLQSGSFLYLHPGEGMGGSSEDGGSA